MLDTDRGEFGGKNRLGGGSANIPYLSEGWCNRPYSIKQYIPSRTALVLIPLVNLAKYEKVN